MNIILIAISLSMDAFSLALAYGTLGNKLVNLKLSFIVGIFHFFMPLLGINLGNLLNFNSNILIFIILLLIGFQMIYETFKNQKLTSLTSLKEMILFALAVSLDSFSLGVGLNYLTQKYLLTAAIFSIFSFSFTYLGLILGNSLNYIIGKFSTILGGITLIIVGILYLI